MDRFNLDYVEKMLPRLEGVKSVLDVGSLDVNGTPRPVVAAAGLAYTGCDLHAGPGVDVVIDVTADFAAVDGAFGGRRFDLVMSLNTIEHLFEPIRALDNMLGLARAGGYLLVIAPCVWEPHSWPRDYYRMLPDFFAGYADSRGLRIVENSMLLSSRDTRAFSRDLKSFPEVVPVRAGGYVARKLRHCLRGLFMPGLKECWPRTSVNVTFKKPLTP